MKTDKRKSSFPFAFGKKAEAAPANPEGEALPSPDAEKKGNNAFSKFRATIKVCLSGYPKMSRAMTDNFIGQGQE